MKYTEKFKGSTKPTLIQFYAEWCAPCRMLSPVVQELATKNNDKLVVEQINVDEQQSVATEFGVRSIPAMFLVVNGEIKWQHVGFLPMNQLIGELEKSTSFSLYK